MTDEEKHQHKNEPKPSKFAMTEDDDLAEELAEAEEHVHMEGCCSCHSNIGK